MNVNSTLQKNNINSALLPSACCLPYPDPNKNKTTSVQFQDVNVRLGKNTILNNVTACIPQGSNTAIIGPNGAGKTTLLLALLGEIPYLGSITFYPNKQKIPLCIGYVPQRFQFDRDIPLTVLEFMVMGQQRMPLWFGIRQHHREHALANLAAVNAEYLYKQKLGALSGGEMQRVLLALALTQQPELLVLDEPTAGVDVQGEQVFCELLERLRQERGFTQVMISHDLPTVTHHATHVICLNHHVIAEGPPREVLTNATLTALFGLHMGLVSTQALPEGKPAFCTGRCCIYGVTNGAD